ncbi:helix-turn-helix domain-containing protein [Larkinella sp. C7]|uniref:helix-turn-helix domain-containing protein n=1 Tax=Larkinella sp. C7 TaxID=2576607 RepID=UPI0011111B24|nr:helix-turn-helix transcriptional regulator [Larkinella sp. C7]
MSDIAQEVGQAIKQARVEAGLTQKELGERMGVGTPTISKYENNGQNLTVQTLKKIAEALKIKLNISFHK